MATVTCTEIGEDWTCSFGDMLADRHIDRQTCSMSHWVHALFSEMLLDAQSLIFRVYFPRSGMYIKQATWKIKPPFDGMLILLLLYQKLLNRTTAIKTINGSWVVCVGWNNVTKSMVTIRSPFCGYSSIYCVELMAKIYRVIQIKSNQLVQENVHMITDLPAKSI